jgi:7-carboxy-7-deazaguanine synthase
MKRFLKEGAEVILETNGSLDIANVPRDVTVVVDRKTPGSGMVSNWLDSNVTRLANGDQIKFVIGSRHDYVWSCQELKRLNLRSFVTVLFSPVAKLLEPGRLAAWIVRDRLDVKFQLQLHKILWGDMKGV